MMKRKAKQMGKRLLSLILALSISTSMLPAAYADTGTTGLSSQDAMVEYISAGDAEIIAGEAEETAAEAQQDEAPEAVVDEVQENEAQDDGFKSLGGYLSDEIGVAYLGHPMTLKVILDREDIDVSFRWQYKNYAEYDGVMLGADVVVDTEYNYGEQDYIHYYYIMEQNEAELLAELPDAKWPGIEMWRAVNEAAKAAGYENNLTFEHEMKNYTVMGYDTQVAYENGELKVSFVKGDAAISTEIVDDVIYSEEGTGLITYDWENIEGATEQEYTFTVMPDDEWRHYRCLITVNDEVYVDEAFEYYSAVEGNEELTKDNIREFATGFVNVGAPTEYAETEVDEPTNEEPTIKLSLWQRFIHWLKKIWKAFAGLFIKPAEAASGPYLSADGNYIGGIDKTWQYITEDYYNLQKSNPSKVGYNPATADSAGVASAWTLIYNNGKITRLDGSDYYGYALFESNKLPVRSDWLGKTIYFRKFGEATITKIKIPAVSTREQYYNEWINVLNIYTSDTVIKSGGSKYTALTFAAGAYSGKLSNGKEGTMVLNPSTLGIETFNQAPEKYLYDAEGTAIYDSVVFNGNVGREPDISGAAYWALKEYLAQGYGMIIGHDTFYAYAGSYYDYRQTPLSDSYGMFNRSETSTSYDDDNFHVNSGRTGHWRLNQLIGWNNGNYVGGVTLENPDEVFYIQGKEEALKLSPSGIFSFGNEFGNVLTPQSESALDGLFGDNDLRIAKVDYSYQQAVNNVKYRQPTNFPFNSSSGKAFAKGAVYEASYTHTNHQVTYGDVWVDYDRNASTADASLGYTNNFYLSGKGNFLMNQYGHDADIEHLGKDFEVKLLINSVFYVSQRKQCEVCASAQGQSNTNVPVHFVHRINSANASEVLSALQEGGTFWYPLNDCYMLTENITLPEGWTGIDNFNGHFNADGHEVNLASNKNPLFNQSTASASGWNLGTNSKKGVAKIFNNNLERTTGVARVSGFLNILFNTTEDYTGYVVKILGSDNLKYMSSSESYSSFVNNENKYVLSNLPTLYNETAQTGVLKVRVYDTSGKEVTKYGKICVNIPTNFWDKNMTTELYLSSVVAYPLQAETVYEGQKVAFTAKSSSDSNTQVVGWQYREKSAGTWKDIPKVWVTDGTISYSEATSVKEDGDTTVTQTMFVNKAAYSMNEYSFRAVFKADDRGTWNTYQYYSVGCMNYNTPAIGSVSVPVSRTNNNNNGKLTVKLWPAKLTQGANQTAYEGLGATFTSTLYALVDPSTVKATWEYFSTSNSNHAWQVVESVDDFAHTENIKVTKVIKNDTETAVNNVIAAYGYQGGNPKADFYAQNDFYLITTTLDISKIDRAQNEYQFRVHYTAKTPSGVDVEWYSDIANGLAHAWSSEESYWVGYKGAVKNANKNKLTVELPAVYVEMELASSQTDTALREDTITPDAYGQSLSISSSGVASGSAVYRAYVYYKPGELEPDVTWEYRTFTNSAARNWNQTVARQLFSGINVTITNTPKGAASGDWAGYNVMESVMTISNVPEAAYNSENLLKYFFRCKANLTYETARTTRVGNYVDNVWGGLMLSYDISIRHNGVFGNLTGKNTLADSGWKNVTAVTTVNEIVEFTTNKTITEWRYPNLRVIMPSGKTVKTVMTYFDGSFDSRDKIYVDTSKLSGIASNVVVEGNNTSAVKFTISSGSVTAAKWEQILREAVKYIVYDPLDFTNAESGTFGGAEVRWFISDQALGGVHIDAVGGNAYKVVTASSDVSYSTAKSEAEKEDTTTGLSGYLVKINNAKESELIKQLLGGKVGYIGSHFNSGSAPSDKPNLTMNASGNPEWVASATTTPYNNMVYSSSKHSAQGSGKSWDAWTTSKFTITDTKYQTGTTSFTVNYYAKSSGSPSGPDSDYEGNVRAYVYWIDGAGVEHDQRIFYISGSSSSETVGPTDITIQTNGLKEVRGLIWNHASQYSYSANMYIENLRLTGSVEGRAAIKSYVIEYELGQLGVISTTHSAEDVDYIGTGVIVPDLEAIAVISMPDNEKVYDGSPLTPLNFVVTGENATLDDFEITYAPAKSNGPKDGYQARTVKGSNWRSTGIINVGEYTATVALSAAGKAKGLILNEADSVMQCSLKVTPRTVTMKSEDNDKVYDGTSDAVIDNLQIVSPGIAVNGLGLSKTSGLKGEYLDNSGNADKNVGNKPIKLLETVTLTNNALGNFVLDGYDITGNITPRTINIHSKYKETTQTVWNPETKASETVTLNGNPRNIKAYDATRTIYITDFVIDNVVKGDTVAVKEGGYQAVFSSANASESLQTDTYGDGTVLEDRFNNLTERQLDMVTPLTNADLANNEAGNYQVGTQSYSGSIYRAPLYVTIKNTSMTYGEVQFEEPYVDDEYYSAVNDGSDSYLKISGFQGADKLHIVNDKLDSSYASKFLFTTIPPTAIAGTSQKVSYVGLNESNYKLLENYVIYQITGSVNVIPRELKVIVEGGYIKQYLDNNPKFTVKYEGLVNGDTPETVLDGTLEITTEATQNSTIRYRADKDGNIIDKITSPADEHVDGSYDSYPVIASGYTVKPNVNGSYNYILSYVDGDLTITEGDYEIEYKGNGATEGSILNTYHTYNHTDEIPKNVFARQYFVVYDYNYGGYWTSPTQKSEKVNYKFMGWTTDATKPSASIDYGASLFKKGTPESPVTNGDTMIADGSFVLNLQYTATDKLATLYALWQPKSVSLPNANRRGYEFDGWYEDSNSITDRDGTGDEWYDVDGDGLYEHYVGDSKDKYTPTRNVTLYAKWNVINNVFGAVINTTPASPFAGTNNFNVSEDGEVSIEIFGPVTKVKVEYPNSLVELDRAVLTETCNLETKEYVVGDGHLIEVIPGQYYILKPTFRIPYDVGKNFDQYDGVMQTVVVTATFGPHGALTANPIFYIVDNSSIKFHTILE